MISERIIHSTIHQSTYFYKVAPGLVRGIFCGMIANKFAICRNIQIVGRVAHNLDYVLMAYSKVENSALPSSCPAWTEPVRIRAL